MEHILHDRFLGRRESRLKRLLKAACGPIREPVYINGRYYVLSEALSMIYTCDIYDVSSGWMKTAGPRMSGLSIRCR